MRVNDTYIYVIYVIFDENNSPWPPVPSATHRRFETSPEQTRFQDALSSGPGIDSSCPGERSYLEAEFRCGLHARVNRAMGNTQCLDDFHLKATQSTVPYHPQAVVCPEIQAITQGRFGRHRFMGKALWDVQHITGTQLFIHHRFRKVVLIIIKNRR